MKNLYKARDLADEVWLSLEVRPRALDLMWRKALLKVRRFGKSPRLASFAVSRFRGNRRYRRSRRRRGRSAGRRARLAPGRRPSDGADRARATKTPPGPSAGPGSQARRVGPGHPRVETKIGAKRGAVAGAAAGPKGRALVPTRPKMPAAPPKPGGRPPARRATRPGASGKKARRSSGKKVRVKKKASRKRRREPVDEDDAIDQGLEWKGRKKK